MTALPPEIAYGFVTDRIVLGIGDGPDPDRLPDPRPAEGTVKFTPKRKVIKVNLPEPGRVLPQAVEGRLDADGRLVDDQGAPGVWLVEGAWTVTYKFQSVSVGQHDILVTPEHTEENPLYLSQHMPPGGPVLSATQYAELHARIDGLEVGGGAPAEHDHAMGDVTGLVDQLSGTVYEGDTPIDFGPGTGASVADVAGSAYVTAANSLGYFDTVGVSVNGLLVRSGIQTLTNPTTIPVDGPERLDLVFTEPTTVSFEEPVVPADPSISSSQAPGATDLVLSIEGYEHVTWDGVAVHGTPDQSGVVWASALWRQRDSSWHLLCEQDASQGGGSGMRLVKFESPMLVYRPVPGGPVDEKGLPTTFETVQGSETPLTHYEMVATFADPTTGEPSEAFVDFLPPGPDFVSSSSLRYINFAYFNSEEEPTEGLMIHGAFDFAAGKWTLQGTLYLMDGFTFPNTGPFRVASAEMVPDFLGVSYLSIPLPTPWGGVFALQIQEGVGVVLSYPPSNPLTYEPNPPIPPAPADPDNPDAPRMHQIQYDETGTFTHREVRLPGGGA